MHMITQGQKPPAILMKISIVEKVKNASTYRGYYKMEKYGQVIEQSQHKPIKPGNCGTTENYGGSSTGKTWSKKIILGNYGLT